MNECFIYVKVILVFIAEKFVSKIIFLLIFQILRKIWFQICPQGRYGTDCANECQCSKEGAECNHITGKCNCLPGLSIFANSLHSNWICHWFDDGNEHAYSSIWSIGWRGETCSEQCDPGFFGIDCKQECNCMNGGNCRPTDGFCRCKQGFMGTRCSEICKFSQFINEFPLNYHFFKVPKGFMAITVWLVVNVRHLITFAITCLDVFANTVFVWDF